MRLILALLPLAACTQQPGFQDYEIHAFNSCIEKIARDHDIDANVLSGESYALGPDGYSVSIKEEPSGKLWNCGESGGGSWND